MPLGAPGLDFGLPRAASRAPFLRKSWDISSEFFARICAPLFNAIRKASGNHATNEEQRGLQVHFRCLEKQHQATKTTVVVVGVVVVGGGGVVIVVIVVVALSLLFKFAYNFVFCLILKSFWRLRRTGGGPGLSEESPRAPWGPVGRFSYIFINFESRFGTILHPFWFMCCVILFFV